MPDSPTVTITINEKPRVVTFDFDRLIAIEEATGQNAMQIVAEFVPAGPAPAEGQPPDPSQVRAAIAKFSIKFAGKFIAGCLGVPFSQVGQLVPLRDFNTTFFALFSGFVAALNQLSGDEANPTQKVTAAFGG